ncbi:alpha/beta hydrolase [Pelagerythrobacter sp.]|uniref:alpha/beta hydrolase n=1 Tax=Pelagerythrobacter sp. TaxID=2800702 RepID=UPI0035B2ECE6
MTMRALVSTALVCLLAALAFPAAAQPRMDLTAPETIADRGAPGYRFETLHIASEDGERRYRVTVGIPEGALPATGRPALWMLDGKAALAHIDEALLAEVDANARPVLVAIGHDTPLRLDAAERYRDYTPSAGTHNSRGRQGGGANAFLDTIEHRIRPEVAKLTRLDPERQALWGHSLGGLFVLHTLFERPDAFSHYFATSPSLWWDEGVIVEAGRAFAGAADKHVVIATGSDGGSPRRREARSRFAGPTTDEFVEALANKPGLDVRRITYPGLGHGGTLRASIPDALRAAIRSEPTP